jgi:hypothetical protein
MPFEYRRTRLSVEERDRTGTAVADRGGPCVLAADANPYTATDCERQR